jgi:hypothetical protein
VVKSSERPSGRSLSSLAPKSRLEKKSSEVGVPGACGQFFETQNEMIRWALALLNTFDPVGDNFVSGYFLRLRGEG